MNTSRRILDERHLAIEQIARVGNDDGGEQDRRDQVVEPQPRMRFQAMASWLGVQQAGAVAGLLESAARAAAVIRFGTVPAR
jgi:hypothetical protein